MQSPALPPEGLLNIFDHFQAHPANPFKGASADLAAGCLVSKAWLEPTRDVLYHTISLNLTVHTRRQSCLEVAAERLAGTVGEEDKVLGVPSPSSLSHAHGTTRRTRLLTFGADNWSKPEGLYSVEALAQSMANFASPAFSASTWPMCPTAGGKSQLYPLRPSFNKLTS